MSLKRATILLMFLALMSRFLGVGREMAVASEFGVSAESDAFFIAYSIPFAFYSIVGVSLTAVIVPMLADFDASGNTERGLAVASSAINIVLIFSALIAALGMVFSDQIAQFMGGSFPSETLHLTSRLIAIILPSIVCMSIAGIISGILNNYKVYAAPATGPVIMNAVAIGSMIFTSTFGIEAPVIGVLAGSVFYVLYQIPSLSKIGFKYRFAIIREANILTKLISSVWSVMAVSICYFSYNLTDYKIASGLNEGSIAALTYATRFIQVPQGLFTLAVTTAIFPSLSAYAARGEHANVRNMLEKGIRAILLLAVPTSAVLLVIGNSIMMVLFQHGKFDADATAMATNTLAYLTIGLVGFSLNLPLIRCFYSLNMHRVPLLILLGSIPIKILLSSVLSGVMDGSGLALATSATYSINAAVMVLFLRRHLTGLLGLEFGIFTLRLVATSACMVAVVFFVDKGLGNVMPETHLATFARIAISCCVAGLAYVGFGLVFAMNELSVPVKTVWWRSAKALSREVRKLRGIS